MRNKCEYPDCDCEINRGYCEVSGLRFEDQDEPPLRERTTRERVADFMRPGLGLAVLAWRWITGGGRR